MPRSIQAVKRWLTGTQTKDLKFSDIWKIILIRVADRATDHVDEEGSRLIDDRDGPYSYDLSSIVEDDDIQIGSKDLQRVASYLEEHKWAKLTRRSPPKMVLTIEGLEKAQDILDEVSELPDENEAWTFGSDRSLNDWLLFHGFRAFALGQPYSQDGMVNFRKIADHYTRPITNKELRNALSNLEFNELIAIDIGPVEGKFWAHFNHGGEVAAKLIEEIWNAKPAVPASNRFVRIDDNLPNYSEAISNLEKLISEMGEIRVNDWPEKEGMIATLRGAFEAIKSKYVNKTSVLAAISSITTFIMIKFAEAPIAELASKTWAAIKVLF